MVNNWGNLGPATARWLLILQHNIPMIFKLTSHIYSNLLVHGNDVRLLNMNKSKLLLSAKKDITTGFESNKIKHCGKAWTIRGLINMSLLSCCGVVDTNNVVSRLSGNILRKLSDKSHVNETTNIELVAVNRQHFISTNNELRPYFLNVWPSTHLIAKYIAMIR